MTILTKLTVLVIVCFLVITQSTAAPAATFKLDNFSWTTICDAQSSQPHLLLDSVSQFQVTVSPLSRDIKYSRPAIAFDSTDVTLTPPVAAFDSSIRLQCSINNTQFTAPWTTHHQISKVNGMKKVGVHWFYDIPEQYIPKTAMTFLPFKLVCSVYTSDPRSIATAFLSVVDINTPARDYSFGCGIYGETKGNACLDISSNPRQSQLLTHQEQLQLPQSPNIDPVLSQPFLSLTQQLFPTTGKPERTIPSPMIAEYTISNLKMSPLQPVGNWWIGNTTFTVNVVSPPSSSSRTVLAVSASKVLPEDNYNRVECFYQNTAPFQFSSRYGSYWIANLPNTTATTFSVLCRFRSSYSSTQFFMKIAEQSLGDITCKDPFQCNETYSHTDKPNPDDACIHILYK